VDGEKAPLQGCLSGILGVMLLKLLVIALFGLVIWTMAELAFQGEFTFGQTIKDWLL
jgi:type IV secretory pathway TrbD component